MQCFCIRMFDSDDVKDHRLTVHELEKGEQEVYIVGCLQRIGDRESRKCKRKRTRFRCVHSGLLEVFRHTTALGLLSMT